MYHISASLTRLRRPPISTHLPYTTLFRSIRWTPRTEPGEPTPSPRRSSPGRTPRTSPTASRPVSHSNSSPTSWVTPERERSPSRSEEHTSELQSLALLVCRLLLDKKKL